MTRTRQQTLGKVATPAAATSAATIPPRRRWLRFSLRSLLILITILSIWLGVKVNQARRQKEAVAALRELGATVVYAHQWVDFDTGKPAGQLRVPGWLLELAGDDFFQTVTKVQISRPVSDADLVHLAALPAIEDLNLHNAGRGVTDAGLAHLPRPDRLTLFLGNGTSAGDEFLRRLSTADSLVTLGLGETRVTDDGLRWLAGLDRLTNLALDGTQVSNAGLDSLRNIPALVGLHLGATRITDAGLAKLARHKTLRDLQLNDTAVTDAGLEHLATLAVLNELGLAGTRVRGPGLAYVAPLLSGSLILQGAPIDDASLAYLKEAQNLEALNLEHTTITDAGLVHLHGLPKLSAICLEGTKVTKEGIARLAKAIPGLAVVTAPNGQ